MCIRDSSRFELIPSGAKPHKDPSEAVQYRNWVGLGSPGEHAEVLPLPQDVFVKLFPNVVTNLMPPLPSSRAASPEPPAPIAAAGGPVDELDPTARGAAAPRQDEARGVRESAGGGPQPAPAVPEQPATCQDRTVLALSLIHI